MRFPLKELEERYDLELDRLVSEINSSEKKNILLQLPEGLKPWAIPLVDYLEEKTTANISIWLGDCFGSCDVPNSDTDLLVQFGHAPWD